MTDVEKELVQVAAVATKMLQQKYGWSGAQTVLAIMSEVDRSNKKFGDQSHRSNFEWLSILTEEVGEVAKALNDETLAKEAKV